MGAGTEVSIAPWLAVPDGQATVAVGPVAEAHGWRTGRLTDPFGYDWEPSREEPAK